MSIALIYEYLILFYDTLLSFILTCGISSIETMVDFIFSADGYLVINTTFSGSVVVENIFFSALGFVYDLPIVGWLVEGFLDAFLDLVGQVNTLLFRPIFMYQGLTLGDIPFYFGIISYFIKFVVIGGVWTLIKYIINISNPNIAI